MEGFLAKKARKRGKERAQEGRQWKKKERKEDLETLRRFSALIFPVVNKFKGIERMRFFGRLFDIDIASSIK